MTEPLEVRQHGVRPIDGETAKNEQSCNIFDVPDVDIRNGKIDHILQLICACLNSKQRSLDKFELQFNIVKYAERIKSHEFDAFYKKIEAKLVDNFCKNFCDFIERKGDCDSDRLKIIIRKSPTLYSIKNYLYIPTESSVYESPFEKAVCILRQTGDSEKLPKPVKKGSYKICDIVINLRQENVNVQFKTLNTEKNIGKNIADHFKYISAFANKDGGCLYFGIDDNNGRVVGVNSEKRDIIEKVLTTRINSMILASGYEKKRKLERGVHWNIEYIDIEADNTLSDLYVAKYKPTHLNCKSGELLKLISNDGRDLGTFKQWKKRRDDEHEEENIGFVLMSSVIECFRYEAISEYESVKEGDMLTSFENAPATDGLINCTKTNGDKSKMPFKMVSKSDGEWYKYTSKIPATKKNKFDMFYGKDDVLIFVEEEDNKWWKMKKLIDKNMKTEFSMPRSHLKQLHIGEDPQGTIQEMETEERNIVVITVAKIPGGVLTACPLSYYADDQGCVQKYTFPQWKVDMVKSRPGPCNIEIWDLEQNLMNTANDGILKECIIESKCVILKGLSGTGKTSLALKYCLNFKEKNPLSVAWKFKCSSIELLQESMHELWHQITTHFNKNMNQIHSTNIEKLENIIIDELRCRENLSYPHIFLFDDVTETSEKCVVRFSKKCMYVRNMTIIMTTPLLIEITDSKLLPIDGVSFNEAAHIFQINPENAEDGCKKLAKMLLYNPLALCIAKAYMKKCRMTFDRMVKVLDDHGWYAIENSKITKDEFDDRPLTTLVRMIGELEESYKKNKSTHIFEMLLMLQFLEEEDIPAFLFYNMFDTLKVNDFLYEVEYFSLGFGKGSDDDIMLTVNHMAMTALGHCTNENQRKESLTKLLRFFFLSMDKDNNNKESRIRHKALSPHARKVINCVNKSIGCKNMTKEFQMHFIFVSDVVSNTKDMKLNNAQHLFSLLKITDPFDRTDTIDKTVNISKVQLTAKKILASIDDFLRGKSNKTATESVGMEYLLNKYRNIEDRENLCKILSKQHLEKESQLVEAEYNILCQKSVAVPHKDIGPLFLYELVICILHSYGKMSFQETDRSLSTMSQKNYLLVAYILSNKITPGLFQKHDEAHEGSHVSTINLEQRKFGFNSLSTILIERSLLKLEMNEMEDGKETVSTIQKNIDICNERLNETKHYLEFGVFKVDTKFCQLCKFRWMEHKISLCNKLINVDSSSNRHRVMAECENLKTHIESMLNNTYKIELQVALGTLYFDVEEFKLAEALFELLHQNIKCIPDDDRTSNYTNLLNTSTVYYISCRNKRKNVGQDFHIKTETMLKTSLMDFQLNKNITDELQKLSQELEKIKRAYPTWR